MQFSIRRMHLKDANAVNRLSVQLGYSLSVEQTANQIATVLSSIDHAAFVAINNDTVLGWIHAFQPVYLESLPFTEIGGLVVDEAHRGIGIGKALINAVIDWSIEQEIDTIRLRTQVKRKEAHAFYKALQFVEIKEQKVFQLRLVKQ